MRRTIIAGNWKMHKTAGEALALLAELKGLPGERPDVDVVVCPPFTALHAIQDAASTAGIGLGGQNMFWKQQGAYTGQISAAMLLDAGAGYVILGHSEARGRFGVPEPDIDQELLRVFGDTDRSVNKKLHAALAEGLIPICCVGETIDERKAGQTDDVVRRQVMQALREIQTEQVGTVVFAYEPVWAIGTGEVCGAEEADRVCGVIREAVSRLFGATSGDAVRIQYGGSVKPDNAAELLGKANIDGALVGGASLKSADFAAIVRAAPR